MQKQYRLTGSRSFDYLYKRGAVYKNHILVLYVAKSKFSLPKVGFSVGKKVGGSVQRNRTKRRLREAFRRELEHIAVGYNYVIVARSGSAERSYDEMREAMISLLKQAGKYALSSEE
ncbi:MAG TPA: ribonuclease P protein component [Clostridiales bacterium]|nr:ribonuclease P protein component [Clostridiales bacterium]HCU56336.1 ribonuclease P protein component [Clostridiales bacterium]